MHWYYSVLRREHKCFQERWNILCSVLRRGEILFIVFSGEVHGVLFIVFSDNVYIMVFTWHIFMLGDSLRMNVYYFLRTGGVVMAYSEQIHTERIFSEGIMNHY